MHLGIKRTLKRFNSERYLSYGHTYVISLETLFQIIKILLKSCIVNFCRRSLRSFSFLRGYPCRVQHERQQQVQDNRRLRLQGDGAGRILSQE